jgi:hypothetical protein
MQNMGELRNGGSIEKRRERQFDLKYSVDLREQLNRHRRIATQIKVILIETNGIDSKELLPNDGELPRSIVLGRNAMTYR